MTSEDRRAIVSLVAFTLGIVALTIGGYFAFRALLWLGAALLT